MALMDSPELLDGMSGPQEVGWGPFDRGHFGERIVPGRELSKWPKRMRYRYSKTPVQAPTGFDGEKLIQRSAQLPSKGDLELEWVFGSNGKCLNNTHATARGEIIYHKAAVVVVHDPVRDTQRHFTYHDDDITCLAVDPSGTVAASGQMGRNPRICVWDLATFEVLAVVGGMKHGKTGGGHGKDDGFFERSVCAVEFCSADAGFIMGVGDDDHHSLGVWKWRLSARELEGLQMHGLMSTGEPSPGKLIGEAATMNGEPPQIYDLIVPDRRAVARQEALGSGGSLNSKIQKFVTVGNSHTKFWTVDLNASIASGKSPITSRNARYSTGSKRSGGSRMPRKTLCAAFAPDGKTVFTGTSNGYIYVWDSNNGECIQSFLHHPTAKSPAAAAQAVLSARGGNKSRGASSSRRKPKPYPVQAVCVIPSGTSGGYGFTILSGAVDGTVRRHRVSMSSHGRKQFSVQSASVGSAPLCDLMSLYREHRETVKNSNMNQTDTIIAPRASERMLSFKKTGAGGRGEDKGRGDPSRGSPEEDDPKSGEKLSKKQKAAILRKENMSNLRARHAVTSFVLVDAQSKSGSSSGAVFVATRRGDIWRLDLSTHKTDHFVHSHFGPVYGVCPHPTIPSRFATAGEDQMLIIWDGHTQLCSQYLPTTARSVAYSPDGKHIAVGCGNGAVLIYKFQKERPRAGVFASLTFFKVVQDCVEYIDDLKYSPNGMYLAVASHDNYVDVYSVKRDRGSMGSSRLRRASADERDDAYLHISRCRGHTSYVTHVDWSLDSRVLQSNCGAYEIIYWDAASGRPILSSTDTVEADTEWKDWTCVLGFPVMGIWSEGTDGTDVNSCHMSSDKNHLVTGDDFGKPRLRIAKAIARATGLSRRASERLIFEKKVTLNGSVVENPATHVHLLEEDANARGRRQQKRKQQRDGVAPPKLQHDELWVAGHGRINLATVRANSGSKGGKTRLWALHKLRNELVTNFDPEGRPTVWHRIEEMIGRQTLRTLGMKSVGRLDFMSEGLLLITNDGVLKRYLELPEHGFERQYEVETRGKLNTKWLDYLGKGATVGDFKYKPIMIDVTQELTHKRHRMEITLKEGKSREIRKALEAGGMSVKRLKRIGYGPYHLGGLGKGDLLEIKPRRKHLVDSGILVRESI
eukprot:g3868.t1